MSRRKILIVDDHWVVIEGLKSALRGYPEFEVVGEASSGHQAVKQAKSLKPDMVIMDISMPDSNGSESALQIKGFDPDVRIIVFTMYSDKKHIINLYKAGISAYILKEDPLSELILGINAVSRGGTYFSRIPSRVLLEHIIDLEEGKRRKSGLESLSMREREVLKLLADGKSIKGIAIQLCISPKTVESHKYNIMEKLGVRTVAELTKIAIKRNLIQI
jgi:DNA-binding NarL/FixJ family response regulator